MKQLFLTVFIFLAAIGLSSCSPYLLIPELSGADQIDEWINRETGREVAIMPMIHIQVPEYFEKTKVEIEKYRQKGFVCFYEGVSDFSPRQAAIYKSLSDSLSSYEAMMAIYNEYPYTEEDLAAMDTIYRKFRRITGIYLTNSTDKSNKTRPAFNKRDKYVDQTMANQGLTTPTDMRVDILFPDLIAAYEDKYGEIKLSRCDRRTPLNDEYDCHTVHLYKAKRMTQGLRNSYIMKTVLESEHDKILLIYGAGHQDYFCSDLRKAGFKRKRYGE